ncbi:MAG: EAL domain-containing protein [Rhizobiales bacterium]|nr:EAL domain-containing protein [Hyphomicrobiales bacterium]
MHGLATAPVAPSRAAMNPGDVLTALSSTIYEWDIVNDRIRWGDNAAAVLGLADMGRLASGQGWRKFVSARSIATREDVVAAATEADLGAGVPFQAHYEITLPHRAVAVEDHGRWFAGLDGRPALAHGMIRIASHGVVSVPHDIGASARADLLHRIDLAMTASRRDGRPFMLLTGALRDYASVEARHGSESANALVTAALGRLQRVIRHADSLIRYGSNSFALLMGRCPRGELENAAARLSAAACGAPLESDAGRFQTDMSWGAVIDLDAASGPREVLRRAEDAMQQAIVRAAAVVPHAPDRGKDARRRSEQTVAEQVVQALNDRRILIARQPVVDAATRAVRFEEALVRMRGETGEIIGAAAMIPLFEKLGRIELIDHRVLELAIEALAAEPHATLSVNVSATTLMRDHWLGALSGAVLGRADLADRLIVEMTESQAILDLPGTRRIFSKLKAMGLRTALDDFGAGYTSFKHLRGLDIDILKIDGAFVQNIGASADDSFFVRTLIDLARHLEIEIVAEWVADEDAARKLTGWGATYLQGDGVAPAAIGRPPARLAQLA